MIPIYKPYLNNTTKQFVQDALDSGWISSQGKYVEIAKQLLRERLNVKHAILTCNGTAATYCLAKALNAIDPSRDTIITSNNSYVASVNSFLHDQKFVIRTLDANALTWNLDVNSSRFEELVQSANAALLVVHNMGNPINVPELKRRYPKLLIVEDACEALFGEYEGVPAGSAALASSFSFFANKTITSGEGGAFVTNNDRLAEYISSYVNQGNTSTRFVHDTLAHNFRMTNLQAAMLCGQLESRDEILAKKHSVFEAYKSILSDLANITYQTPSVDVKVAEWMFALKFEGNKTYLEAERYFAERGIDVRPMFYPYSRHAHLVNNSRVICDSSVVARELSEKIVVLPSYPELTIEQIERVCAVLKEFLES